MTRVARAPVGEHDPVQVRVVAGAGRDDRAAQHAGALERLERRVVGVPDRQARGGDLRDALELLGQQRRRHVGHEKRRADVDPRVLVDLAAREALAVGALLLQDLGALRPARVVDEQRAALAAGDVLRLVEGERAEVADRAERAAVERRADALRGVLDEQQPVLAARARRAPPCRSRRRRSARRRSTRVRSVIASAARAGSRFSVSGSTSTKTGVAPRRTNALAVEENVNEGMITSSPGPTSDSSAVISSAPVQECVMSTRAGVPVSSRMSAWQCSPAGPLPPVQPRSSAAAMRAFSPPVRSGRLNGSRLMRAPAPAAARQDVEVLAAAGHGAWKAIASPKSPRMSARSDSASKRCACAPAAVAAAPAPRRATSPSAAGGEVAHGLGDDHRCARRRRACGARSPPRRAGSGRGSPA